MHQIIDITTLWQGYSFHELRMRLGRVRLAPVPPKTLYRWLDTLGIATKDEYTEDEFRLLTALCLHYQRGGSTKSFIDKLDRLYKEQKNAES